MTPAMFEYANESAVVKQHLGSGAAMRFHEFGEATQTPQHPYAVWQLVGGAPENQLAGIPRMDTARVQVDVYADKPSKARVIALALRDALEPHGYVTAYNFEIREPDSRLFRFSFSAEFMTPREVLT